MSTAETIYEQVKTLPEPAAREVLDFVKFIESRLARQAGKTAKKRPAATAGAWPELVLSFNGEPELPPFEQDRSQLLPPVEDPLA